MEKKIFSVFFLAIPISLMILLTVIKISVPNTDFWTAFESYLPIIVFHYMIVSFFGVINMDKIKKLLQVKLSAKKRLTSVTRDS